MKAIMEPMTTEETRNSAFEKLFEDHHRMVYRAALRVLGSRQDAEDVMQRVFTRMVVRVSSPDFIKNVKAYLYEAAVREASCVLRWRRRREFVDQDTEHLVDPESEPQDHHIRGPLRDAMAKLKPQVVEMLRLQYEEGCSDAEIAQMMGKPRIVVAMRLHRARRRLEKLLTGKKGEK